MQEYVKEAMKILGVDNFEYRCSYLNLFINNEYRTAYLNPLYIENTKNPVDSIIYELSWRLK